MWNAALWALPLIVIPSLPAQTVPDASKPVIRSAGDALLEVIAERKTDARIVTVDNQEDVLRAVYIALVAGPLLLIIGGVLVWSRMLRRRSAARTAELRRSTELQRAMVECSPVALFTIDTNGNVLAWNASAERIFGWTEEEVVGKPLPIVPEEKRDEFASLRGEIAGGRSFAGRELMRLNKSGSLFPIRLSAAPILDDKGAVVAIMATAEDITARKRAEEELARQHRLLQIAGTTARFGGWNVDLATNTVAWSAVVCDMHGIPRGYSPKIDEGIDFYAPEWRERIKQVFADCAEKGVPFDEEMEIITASGERVSVRTSGEAITDEAGRIIQVHGSFQDISRQKASEKALRRSETRYRLLADNTLDVIWVLNVELVFTYVNPAIEQLMGYAPDEWIGSRLSVHCDAEHFSQIEAVVRQAIAKGTGNQGMVLETEMLRKDGTAIPLEIHAKVVFEGNGAPVHIQGVARDITARLRLESQLRQAEKMEAIGRLAGGVAHDFNNLLMGIMNYVELCRDGIEPDHPVREWLDEIAHEAERSANLTRQLLAFARKQTVDPQVLNLNETVENMLKMLRRLIGEDIDLLWRPAYKLWQVKMDPGQVDQILANLCVNARDAIAGAGKVTIETENAVIGEDYSAEQHYYVRPGRYVRLAVSDDGSGMDRETLEDIFEPFYTTKSAGEGTGLGLATVYGIVKQNEGFINAYSEPGNGTTFRICLPCVEGGEPAQEGAADKEKRGGGSETILLVEDEKSIRKTTALLLEALGYTVLTAETAEEALQRAATHAGGIHLLITDVVMPGMSGRGLAEKLTEEYPAMKCLFISGYTAEVIAHRGILDADVEFLAKPFTRDEIAHKVREVLG